MGCPSLEEINGILQEEESSPRIHEFICHVDVCPKCQAALAELSELPMDHDIGDIFASPRQNPTPEPNVNPAEPFGVLPQEKSSRIGPLRIERKLGEGGMAEVFACYDERVDRMVAVKVIDSSVISSRNLERLELEARIHARLKHPNVVSLLEFKIDNGLPYIVMELVEGGTLKELFLSRRVRPRQLARIMRDVALAVQAAHDLNILHRDLKPANILLQNSKPGFAFGFQTNTAAGSIVPKVSDFGLAKLMADDTNLSASAMYLGTPAYMSPEQTTGDSKRIGPAADIYAMGVIVYQGLTGRLPFMGEDITELFERIRNLTPVNPSQFQPGIPVDLETICLKCLEKDPAARYPNADALAADLTRFLEGSPIVARPIGPLGQLSRWARRNRALACSLALLFASALAFSFWNMKSAGEEAAARQRAEAASIKLNTETSKLREDYAKLQSHFLFAIDQAHKNSTNLARIISEGSNDAQLRKFQRALVIQRGELGERIIPDLDERTAFDAFLVEANYLSGVNAYNREDHKAAAARFLKSVEHARSCRSSGIIDPDTTYFALRSFNHLAAYEIERGNCKAAFDILAEAWESLASHGDDYVLTRDLKCMSLETAFRLQSCLESLGRFDEASRLTATIEKIQAVALPPGIKEIDTLY